MEEGEMLRGYYGGKPRITHGGRKVKSDSR